MLLALCILLSLGGISGCSKSVALSGGKRTEKGYSMAQILMIASTEKKRYEEVCTAGIWDVDLGKDGETFEDYLKGKIRNFMDEMKVMNLMAEEREIGLTPQEQAAMSQAAEEYYGALSASDRERMEITQEEVQKLFENYCVAEKLVQELTEGMNLEVSDSEAKVIMIQEAETGDRQAAEAFRMEAAEEAADFTAVAEAAGLQVTELSLGRKEKTASYENTAFSLASGEISPVIEADGSFYVLKCISDYDREATALRKEQIYTQRRQKAFRDLYNSYRQEIHISYSGDPFEKLQMKMDDLAEKADFFEIYKRYIS